MKIRWWQKMILRAVLGKEIYPNFIEFFSNLE